jgi:hypothetical protein
LPPAAGEPRGPRLRGCQGIRNRSSRRDVCISVNRSPASGGFGRCPVLYLVRQSEQAASLKDVARPRINGRSPADRVCALIAYHGRCQPARR